MTDKEFFEFIENSIKDAKALYENEYYQSLQIPIGFDLYWTGFVHGATMFKSKLDSIKEMELEK